ncbi:S8 family serine peptidase [Azonexus sp.]|uniref:S8 family serine peptidase n=1 Tax=Azonexus sp. TaxID=1872668 RepID=UPI0035B001B1
MKSVSIKLSLLGALLSAAFALPVQAEQPQARSLWSGSDHAARSGGFNLEERRRRPIIPPPAPVEPEDPVEPPSTGSELPVIQAWMAPDIGDAWRQGYKGQGTTITVVDDFSNSNPFSGDLGTGKIQQGHGFWTSQQASMVAPEATVVQKHWNSSSSLPLAASGLNVLNLSYGFMAAPGYDVSQMNWDRQQASIIDYARNGSAVVVKSAGNGGVAVGTAEGSYWTGRSLDYLNVALKGAQAAILVGALTSNGSPTKQASLASYSNYPGNDATYQKNFVVVGVASNVTGLAGTSFAAPIVTGYAAVIGSKFTSATPTQVVNQLLNTARTDTLRNYRASVYGRGEASLTRALAPVSIR